MSIVERLKLCWIVLTTRRQAARSLFQASVQINKCVIRGEVNGEATLQKDDGQVVRIEYVLKSKREGAA